jgi:hypothetical protein
MISGRDALATIEGTIAKARSSELEADATLRSAEEDAARLRADRAAAFRQLARVRIDTFVAEGQDQASLIQRLDNAERRALDLVKDRSQKLKQQAASRKALLDAVQASEAERHKLAGTLEQALAGLEAVRRAAEPRIRASAAWQAQLAKIAAAQQIAEESEKKAMLAEADRETKRKPYEDDPLFMYLWKRGYGTPRYAGGGITRLLDGWVARLIGYSEARINYAALTEIPVRLNQYVARLEETARKADEAIHASLLREVAVIAQENIAGRIAALEAELAALEEGVTKREAAFDALSDEVTRLAQGHDPHLEAAVESLASILSSTSFRQLAAEARNTPSLKDDQLLERIRNTASMMAQIEDRVAEHRKRLDQLAARRSDLLRIAAEFRRQRYDDNSSVFTKDEVFSGLLRQLLAGLITAGQYWAEIQRHQTRQRRASDRFPRYDDVILGGGRSWPRGSGGGSWGGGGISFPSGGGGSWGGGGGSSGGGGFRTGGSF